MVETRYNDKGFRLTDCPMCGATVLIASEQDDTRWRYARHLGIQGAVCEMSRQLLAGSDKQQEQADENR